MTDSSSKTDISDFSDLRFVDVAAMPDADSVWDALVDACPDAWYRHTRPLKHYTMAADIGARPVDGSFLVLSGDQPIGLAPMLVREAAGGQREASYYGGPMPWPCLLPEALTRKGLEAVVLAEVERRAAALGAQRIRLQLSAPLFEPSHRQRFNAALRNRRYLDDSYDSHWMTIGPDSLKGVRERYSRYVKKFRGHFDLAIYDGAAVDAAIEEDYFVLHVKDAGRQTRPRESYAAQADLARQGLGFFVGARHRESGRMAGLLLITLYKGHAYDASVGVDPDFQEEFVSHLMKWTAIEEMQRRGVQSYELGIRAQTPDWLSIPDDKNYGISFFKEGWARDADKPVLIADKFLDRAALDAHCARLADRTAAYFGL